MRGLYRGLLCVLIFFAHQMVSTVAAKPPRPPFIHTLEHDHDTHYEHNLIVPSLATYARTMVRPLAHTTAAGAGPSFNSDRILSTFSTVFSESDLAAAVDIDSSTSAILFSNDVTMTKASGVWGLYPINVCWILKDFSIDGGGFELSSSGDNNATFGLYIDSSTVFIKDLTLRGFLDVGSLGGPALYATSSTVHLERISILQSITVSGGGGGMHFISSRLVFDGGLVKGNTAGSEGGGCWLSNSVANFTGVTFANNVANAKNLYFGFGGGGMYIDGSRIRLTRCNVTENSEASRYDGGGIFVHNTFQNDDFMESSLALIDTAVTKNTAGGSGGGIGVSSSAVLSIEGGELSGNVASQGGGLNADSSSVVSITKGRVASNTAGFGGGIAVAGALTVLTLHDVSIVENRALTAGGGGLWVTSGIVDALRCTVSHNFAEGPTFIDLSNGESSCTTRGGCLYSSNFPIDYFKQDNCMWTPSQAGILNVVKFSTEECCDTFYITPESYTEEQQSYDFSYTSSTAAYSGNIGPDAVNVNFGDILFWESDGDTQRGGFAICFSPTSSGGGIMVEEGEVSFVDGEITHNWANLYGGGLFLHGGAVDLEGVYLEENEASSVDGGQAMSFESGTLSATRLSVGYHNESLSALVTGGSALSTTCLSHCPAGEFGICERATGTAICFVNCVCSKCLAGKVSAVVGATSDTCSDCGAGQISAAGDAQCSTCAPGTYASDNATERGGGLLSQVSFGAISCNNCPAGFVTPSGASIVCAACPAGFVSAAGKSECSACPPGSFNSISGSGVCNDCIGDFFSKPGSTSCTYCLRSFFYSVDGICEKCPQGAVCNINGNSTQRFLQLRKKYWRISPNSVDVYECPYAKACDGGLGLDEGDDTVPFGDQYCALGHSGPLCGVCDRGWFFDPDAANCAECDGERTDLRFLSSPTIVIFMVIVFIVAVATVAAAVSARNTFLAALRNNDEKTSALVNKVKKLFPEVGSTKINMDGSVTLTVEKTSDVPPKEKETVEITTSPYAIITKVTDTMTESSETVTQTITIKPSGWIISKIMTLRAAQVKVKSLTAFGQIGINIGFNCNVTFPSSFTNVVNVIKFLDLDIAPSLGLNCHFSDFDYIDTMVAVTLGPIFIAILLLIVYIYLSMKTKGLDPEVVARANTYAVPVGLQGAFSSTEENEFKLIFAMMDTDGGGDVDEEEIINAALSVDPNACREEVEREIEALLQESGGGDDRIDFGEFLLACHRSRVQGKSNKLAELASAEEAKAKKNRGSVVVYAFLFLAFLVLVKSSSTLLNYFKCSSFKIPEVDGGGNDRRFLQKDYSLDCDGGRYKSFLVFAIVMVFIYPVGIPCMYGVMLFKERNILKDIGAMNRELANGYPRVSHVLFLVEAYSPEYYYFEVLECFRRLILAAAIGMLPEGSAASAVLGVLVGLGFMHVFTAWKPYKTDSDNSLGVVLAQSLVLLFFAALLVKVDLASEDRQFQTLFGGFMVAILLSGPIGIVYELSGGYIHNCCTALASSIMFKTGVYKKQTRKSAAAVELAFVRSQLVNPDEQEGGPDAAAILVRDNQGVLNGEIVNMALECQCGNRLKGDSIFCRICGTKRPSLEEALAAKDDRLVAESLLAQHWETMQSMEEELPSVDEEADFVQAGTSVQREETVPCNGEEHANLLNALLDAVRDDAAEADDVEVRWSDGGDSEARQTSLEFNFIQALVHAAAEEDNRGKVTVHEEQRPRRNLQSVDTVPVERDWRQGRDTTL